MWILAETYFVLDFDRTETGADNLTITIMGVRAASRKRDALWDFGIVAIPSEGVVGIPWIAATVPF